MADLRIEGNHTLSGTIRPSGNKNSVLPVLCASLLTEEKVVVNNIPNLTDVNKIFDLLEQLGSKITRDTDAQTAHIQNDAISLDEFDGNFPLGMRAAVLLIAPLLYRFKTLSFDTTIGGCTLGMREIDPHINLLEDLGATVERDGSKTTLTLKDGAYNGTTLWPSYASVTTTENILMAATIAKGSTVLMNAASEPHVQDLSRMLVAMGANITGVGSNRVEIKGVEQLGGTTTEISSDHHEITSFLALGAMTGGEIRVEDAIPEHFQLITSEFSKLGVEITYDGTTAIVEKDQSFNPEKPFTSNYTPRIEAAPWPYFPVDLLPLMVALSLKTNGPIRFWNKVYEGGLFWVTELTKMGAKIEICDPHRIIVMGPTELFAATLDCPYIIRATVGLMMAALAAEGTSTLNNVDTIYRAHPNFTENLCSLGAKIEEVGA